MSPTSQREWRTDAVKPHPDDRADFWKGRRVNAHLRARGCERSVLPERTPWGNR